jgi:assimilatory nitrate reductase catalytic subunit
VFVPMHWTDVMAGEGRSNRLPGQSVDPVSGQPGFKNTPARVEPVTPEWRAFLVARDMPELSGLPWWTRGRVAGGWLCELAGMGTLDADALLPAGERTEVADHARGMRRIAVRDAAGALLAALYVTRSGQLPGRDWAAAQLGMAEASALELLAARPSTPAPDRGPIVCICHGVGEKDIAAAALAGAQTVEAIGCDTRAGTNCGSCRPAIARLLAATLAQEREAAE